MTTNEKAALESLVAAMKLQGWDVSIKGAFLKVAEYPMLNGPVVIENDRGEVRFVWDSISFKKAETLAHRLGDFIRSRNVYPNSLDPKVRAIVRLSNLGR